MSGAANRRVALIGLGANLPSGAGPPAAAVAAALDALARLGPLRASRAWRSPAWPPGGPDYVNAAAALRSLEAALAINPKLAGGQERLRELRRKAEGDAT